VNERLPFQDGEQVLLIDQRGKRHLIFLRKSETFHSDRGWVTHDAIIGQPDGSWVRTSKGTRYLALRPTLAEYVLDMPRGAQVIYPKDLAMVMFWADIFPGARVLEAGMGSGALTLALLRAVAVGDAGGRRLGPLRRLWRGAPLLLEALPVLLVQSEVAILAEPPERRHLPVVHERVPRGAHIEPRLADAAAVVVVLEHPDAEALVEHMCLVDQ